LENYLLEIQKKYLESFCRNEIERFKDGWSVKYTERKFSKNISSLTIYGYIDRVDVRDGEVEVLDYKTGSYNLYNKNSFLRATDFQMEFYYLLAQQIGEVRGCGFYDLKMGKVVLENFLDEKLDILNTHIEELVKNKNIEFDKSEDIKVCKFCEYKIMCNRF
jgi:RecB family exonuclease